MTVSSSTTHTVVVVCSSRLSRCILCRTQNRHSKICPSTDAFCCCCFLLETTLAGVGKSGSSMDESTKDEKDDDSEDDEGAAPKEDDNSSSEEEEDGDDDDEQEAEASDELMELLAQAAAAQGIPLEWLLRRAVQGDADEEDEEPVEYPFDSPPRSLQDVANFIQSDNCRSIVVLAGAGMSVASGIPGT